jgi:[ribosomal protein S5]-alanine N-acetyltransferase
MAATDADDMFLFRGDADAQKFNSEPMKDVGEMRALIEELRAGYANHKRIHWGVTLRDVGTVIGLVGFNDWERAHRRAEIGYDIARAYWGRGIGSEVAQALVLFGFESMDLNRVETITVPENFPSIRLLEKLGFQHEGTWRQRWLEEDGSYQDSALYGLLRSEYSIERQSALFAPARDS